MCIKEIKWNGKHNEPGTLTMQESRVNPVKPNICPMELSLACTLYESQLLEHTCETMLGVRYGVARIRDHLISHFRFLGGQRIRFQFIGSKVVLPLHVEDGSHSFGTLDFDGGSSPQWDGVLGHLHAGGFPSLHFSNHDSEIENKYPQSQVETWVTSNPKINFLPRFSKLKQ